VAVCVAVTLIVTELPRQIITMVRQ